VIERLGPRTGRARAASTQLCKLLGTEAAEDLVRRAIGSLVAIGDPRAVDD